MLIWGNICNKMIIILKFPASIKYFHWSTIRGKILFRNIFYGISGCSDIEIRKMELELFFLFTYYLQNLS